MPLPVLTGPCTGAGAAHRADEISAADMTGRFIGTKILTEGVGCVILVQDKCMVGQSPGMRKF